MNHPVAVVLAFLACGVAPHAEIEGPIRARAGDSILLNASRSVGDAARPLVWRAWGPTRDFQQFDAQGRQCVAVMLPNAKVGTYTFAVMVPGTDAERDVVDLALHQVVVVEGNSGPVPPDNPPIPPDDPPGPPGPGPGPPKSTLSGEATRYIGRFAAMHREFAKAIRAGTYATQSDVVRAMVAARDEIRKPLGLALNAAWSAGAIDATGAIVNREAAARALEDVAAGLEAYRGQ